MITTTHIGPLRYWVVTRNAANLAASFFAFFQVFYEEKALGAPFQEIPNEEIDERISSLKRENTCDPSYHPV